MLLKLIVEVGNLSNYSKYDKLISSVKSRDDEIGFGRKRGREN